MILFDDIGNLDLEARLASPLYQRFTPVAGANGGMGKTALTAALGRRLAEGGTPTLLVDLAGPGGTLHGALCMPLPKPGLGAFLAGTAPLKACIHPVARDLYLLPVDRNHPLSDLSGSAMLGLMDALSLLGYPRVLLDLPSPVIPLTQTAMAACPAPILLGAPTPLGLAGLLGMTRDAITGVFRTYLPDVPLTAELHEILAALPSHLVRSRVRFESGLSRYRPGLLLGRVTQESQLDLLRHGKESLEARLAIAPKVLGAIPESENLADFWTGEGGASLLDRLAVFVHARMVIPSPTMKSSGFHRTAA